MKLNCITKRRATLVLGIGVMALAVWAWRDESSLASRPVPERVSETAGEATASFASRSQRTPRSRGEFLASQKEKHIQRLLASILAALQEKDQLQRSGYLVKQVEALAADDVPLILLRLEDDLRGSEFGVLLVRRWAETAPAAAAAWAQDLVSLEERDVLLKQIASVWSNHDLKGAIDWAKGLADSDGRQAVWLAVTGESIRQQPALALELAASLTSVPEREQVTIRALNEWATQEPVTALSWVAGITDLKWQQQLKASLIQTIASIEGSSGAQLTTSWLMAGPEQERTAVAVVQRWVQQSPEAAAAWVNRFPAGSMRLAALDNLKRIGSLYIPGATEP